MIHRLAYSALFILLLLGSHSAIARPIIADLSLRTIEIDSGFNGIDVLLFGARNDAGDVIVVIRGPKQSYVVRKKERVAGIWVNSKEAEFNDTLSFYSIATSRPLVEIRNDFLLSSLNIGKENLELYEINNDAPEQFRNALISHKEAQNLYPIDIGEVNFIGDTLFRSVLHFPENITRGTYTAEIYLIRDGELIGVQSTPILSYKKGFDAYVYDLAYNYPALYGMIAIFIALTAGWLAGVLFKKV